MSMPPFRKFAVAKDADGIEGYEASINHAFFEESLDIANIAIIRLYNSGKSSFVKAMRGFVHRSATWSLVVPSHSKSMVEQRMSDA